MNDKSEDLTHPEMGTQYQTQPLFMNGDDDADAGRFPDQMQDPITSTDDISLAMRQFYQSPVRAAG